MSHSLRHSDWSISELTCRMRASDEDAWREFHRRYFPRLFSYLAVVLRSDDDPIAECLQLTCLRVVRHIREFDDEQHFWNWLACLAKCATFDHLRGRKRRLAMLEKYAHWKEIQHINTGQGANSPSAISLALEACLDQLTCDDRRLLEGKYVECLTYRELAQIFQITEKAIENRLTRVRRKLRECILKEAHYVP